MWSLIPWLGLALLFNQAQALHFYIDGPTQKCFFEELPKDTMVVGHFGAKQWNAQSRQYVENRDMGIYITVDEVFDNDHRVVNQNSPSSNGKFTFTAADSGDHRLCFTPTGIAHSLGQLLSGSSVGGIQLSLDLVIGATSELESSDKDKMGEVVAKVRDLNARLQDVKREQVHQREREMEFRDQSEHTNGRVVRWTLLQLVVLGVTCAWQLSHLRAFFIKQKLT